MFLGGQTLSHMVSDFDVFVVARVGFVFTRAIDAWLG
jgi:hypothetical protein